MRCINKRCGTELPDDAVYCLKCGRKQVKARSKRRSNNTGSVYKRGSTFTASVIVGYRTEYDESGKATRKPIRKTQAGFTTRTDALNAIPDLRKKEMFQDTSVTFIDLYNRWEPTYTGGKSTLGNYRAAKNYFRPIWHVPLIDIDIDDLQECIDDCERGRRTKENMRALVSLMYKYGIPRNLIYKDRNLAPFLKIDAEASAKKEGFTDAEFALIENAVGTVPYADYIYCLCYTGFRITELMNLQVSDYDPVNKAFTGGIKTEAGINRIVTLSPKIQPIVDRLVAGRKSGQIFRRTTGEEMNPRMFREVNFYPALEAIGIDNPVLETGIHYRTPHTCRHTFANLLKKVEAPSKDKLAMMGHTSEEMLRYYQDTNISDLKKISDAL